MDVDNAFRFSPRPNRAQEIHWRPWSEDAFHEAHRLGRPILLSLSAVWCHWCHVMDETTYSDERVIAAINEGFVPIRVDNDRHPDVNRRYNMGGWPTTAFLAANGDTITGGTYIPPEQMLESLTRVTDFFAANRAALLVLETAEHARAADAEAARASMGSVPFRTAGNAPDFDGDPDVPGDIPAEIALQVVRSFDPVHGGLGADPKFPQADVFEFALAYAELRAGGAAAHVAPHTSGLLSAGRVHEVVRTTLQGMARGDLYDGVAGGFFRYATQRDWSVPHYEKMLEDNARLATLYLDAAVFAREHGGDSPSGLGSPELYRDAGGGTLDYLLGTLWLGDPPAFGGSQDADERYYLLDAVGRSALPKPSVDPTVIVDWNALAARALLRGAVLLRRPDLSDAAVNLLGHLWESARRHGAAAHYLTADGQAAPGSPLLADQAALAAALLDAYEVTAERRWLDGAAELAGWAGENLRAPDGRLYDRLPTPGDSPGLLGRPLPVLDENALMADVLMRLEAYTGEARWRDAALEILMGWISSHEEYGVAAAAYGKALLRYIERPDHIVVTGARGDAAAQRLLAAALVAPRPLRTVQLLDPGDPADARRLEALGLAGPGGGPPALAAYVCRGTTCLAPITDPGALGRPLT